MKFNHRQITFAREYRGYSQSDLASKIKGLYQPNLSKYEKGFDTLSDDMILEIIDYLNFPKEWLFENISNFPESAHYRKRSTLSKKDRDKIELTNRIIAYIVDQMSDSIDWPEFTHVPLDLEDGHTPKSVAKYARKVLGLKNGEPVSDIFTLLENKGIVVVEIDAHEKFDGVTIISDKGTPIIILNKNFSNDRKRRTATHEYGHALMHCFFPIPVHRTEKIREKEADDFANEFLMPEQYIRSSLYNLKISDLAELKRYWLTAMSSIIYRAKDLGCITKDRYTYLNIEFSRSGRKKNEGLDVYIDSPSLFNEAYKIFKYELDYNDSDLGKAFNLPIDIITKHLNPPKLRIIRNE